MSHNASLGSPPHVLSVTPTSFTATGAQSMTINGGNLSATCELVFPAALGTVDGPGVYTAGSATQGDLVFPVTIAAIPDPMVTYTVGLSNGGMESQGVAVTARHGWNPGALCDPTGDGWWRTDDLVETDPSNDNLPCDFPWAPAAGALADIPQPTAYRRSLLLHEDSNMNDKPTLNRWLSADANEFDVDATEWAGASGGWTIAMAIDPYKHSWFGYFYIKTSHIYVYFGNISYTEGFKIWVGGDQTDIIYSFPSAPNQLIMYGTSDSVTLYNGTSLIGTASRASGTTTYTPNLYSHFLDLRLGELVFLNREIDATEKTDLTDYWLEKYGT